MDRPDEHKHEQTPAAAALAVVEALYAFAEEPARWEDVLDAIDALPGPLDANDAVAASIMSHATRASALLERLNSARAPEIGVAWDAILLSSEGRVRGLAGQIAERLTGYLKRAPVAGENLQLRDTSHDAIGKALASAKEEAGGTLAPFTLAGPDDTTRAFGIVLSREAFPATLAAAFGLGNLWAEPMFAVVLLSTRDAQASGAASHRRLGLTAAEARLTAKLVQGLSLSDAADALDVSAHTA